MPQTRPALALAILACGLCGSAEAASVLLQGDEAPLVLGPASLSAERGHSSDTSPAFGTTLLVENEFLNLDTAPPAAPVFSDPVGRSHITGFGTPTARLPR